MSEQPYSNRLVDEKSPYLLQHAHNPVDWYPWGDEALDKAKAEDKPILVSIGYATCHWCHVMERESFEDPELAAYLNERFVAIKVDREERPDVDRIYMDALHLLGEGGGWPLNMFLTSEGLPFTGGTYFPPTARYGRPSFRQVLERIHEIWTRGREQVATTAEHFRETLEKQAKTAVIAADAVLDDAPIALTLQFSKARYDSVYGGFKSQPRNKFPPSMTLMQLLRCDHQASDQHIIEMVEFTLQKMKQGGIYDQIGGGLARYSTDYQWLVPHFEKMLYDNALWIEALTEAFQSTGKKRYRDWVADAIAYIQRDMSHPEGAFFSAEDADSEGVEGKFYVWSEDEIRALLPGEAGELALAYWKVTAEGNFEGHSILWVDRPLAEVAKEQGLPLDRAQKLIEEARQTLLETRSKRPRPLLDDKVLVSWNALMISAFAKAGRVFDEAPWIDAAARAASFIRDRMKDDSGRLLRRFRDGEARYKAYLVDYAQLAVACLDLFEASGELAWFDEARALMAEVDRLFADEGGGYFDTGADAEKLITRTKEAHDGVEPCGNSAAAWAFSRLYALTGDESYHDKARGILLAFKESMDRAGPGLAYMLRSLDYALRGFGQAIVIGTPGEAGFEAMRRELRRGFHPGHIPLVVARKDLDAWRGRFPVLKERGALDGKATAYVCRNQSCDLPVHSAKALAERLD